MTIRTNNNHHIYIALLKNIVYSFKHYESTFMVKQQNKTHSYAHGDKVKVDKKRSIREMTP